MAKAGMRRPDPSDPHAHGDENYGKTNKKPKNEQRPVPEIQGRKKHKGWYDIYSFSSISWLINFI